MYICKWIEVINNVIKFFDMCNYIILNKLFLIWGKGIILYCKDILIYIFGWYNLLKSNKFMFDNYYIVGFLFKLICWKIYVRVCFFIILVLFKCDVLLYIKLWEIF